MGKMSGMGGMDEGEDLALVSGGTGSVLSGRRWST
jgi:hypothetical protein